MQESAITLNKYKNPSPNILPPKLPPYIFIHGAFRGDDIDLRYLPHGSHFRCGKIPVVAGRVAAEKSERAERRTFPNSGAHPTEMC